MFQHTGLHIRCRPVCCLDFEGVTPPPKQNPNPTALKGGVSIIKEILMKTLIIAAHPHIAQSVVNKRWLDELAKHPDRFTVHRLYTAYPDGKIDITREQALVEAHGGIVFQFPVYWFNCPPLLKQWFDDVLTYGWAYGSAGRAFCRAQNRHCRIAGRACRRLPPERRSRLRVGRCIAPVRTDRPLLQCRLVSRRSPSTP